ncbi:hypothetical protein [Streptomyces iconiensis]|uniref:Secreted protein n=1 Tax=Streptomyces iconiensis TaxID=1384038 RepID=A0ABT6ZNY5_9ACTN|nr:hypothetical protein [Streptomyces iconiensis]MDJ1130524.1 hypothetical protein [Streptomyces iconiensis]
MRTSLSSVGALVAAACALAVLPTGAAQAGDGPPPKDHAQVTHTRATPEGNPSSRAAQAAGVCNDAYQIGKTGYIKWRGHTAASVKQFYSPNCHRNYAYMYKWASFHRAHPRMYANVAVHKVRTSELVGLRTWHNTTKRSFWSNPADTVRHCTTARGALRVPGDTKQSFAHSSVRC